MQEEQEGVEVSCPAAAATCCLLLLLLSTSCRNDTTNISQVPLLLLYQSNLRKTTMLSLRSCCSSGRLSSCNKLSRLPPTAAPALAVIVVEAASKGPPTLVEVTKDEDLVGT